MISQPPLQPMYSGIKFSQPQGLTLFGIDVIVDVSGRMAVIDVNYFPGKWQWTMHPVVEYPGVGLSYQRLRYAGIF